MWTPDCMDRGRFSTLADCGNISRKCFEQHGILPGSAQITAFSLRFLPFAFIVGTPLAFRARWMEGRTLVGANVRKGQST